MKVELDLCLKSSEPLTERAGGTLVLNAMPANQFGEKESHRYVVNALEAAQTRAKSEGQSLKASLDLWHLHHSFRDAVAAGEVDYPSIDVILSVIASYRRQVI
jgi:hypothetical protein